MKKKLLFVIPIIIIAVILFMLRMTGMEVHIIASVAGLALLVAYTVINGDKWKIPALEILLRVFYAIALITGGLIMRLQGVVALSVAHKVSAVLFAILLLFTEIHKSIKK